MSASTSPVTPLQYCTDIKLRCSLCSRTFLTILRCWKHTEVYGRANCNRFRGLQDETGKFWGCAVCRKKKLKFHNARVDAITEGIEVCDFEVPTGRVRRVREQASQSRIGHVRTVLAQEGVVGDETHITEMAETGEGPRGKNVGRVQVSAWEPEESGRGPRSLTEQPLYIGKDGIHDERLGEIYRAVNWHGPYQSSSSDASESSMKAAY